MEKKFEVEYGRKRFTLESTEAFLDFLQSRKDVPTWGRYWGALDEADRRLLSEARVSLMLV